MSLRAERSGDPQTPEKRRWENEKKLVFYLFLLDSLFIFAGFFVVFRKIIYEEKPQNAENEIIIEIYIYLNLLLI